MLTFSETRDTENTNSEVLQSLQTLGIQLQIWVLLLSKRTGLAQIFLSTLFPFRRLGIGLTPTTPQEIVRIR